jgi:hypothetical protein
MNQELIDLAIERGRLIERISNQRQLLGQQLQPVGEALETADRAIAAVRKAVTYLKQHPEIVAAGVAVLVVLQPGRVWRWSKRGTFVWRTWRLLRRTDRELGLTHPSRRSRVKRRNIPRRCPRAQSLTEPRRSLPDTQLDQLPGRRFRPTAVGQRARGTRMQHAPGPDLRPGQRCGCPRLGESADADHPFRLQERTTSACRCASQAARSGAASAAGSLSGVRLRPDRKSQRAIVGDEVLGKKRVGSNRSARGTIPTDAAR